MGLRYLDSESWRRWQKSQRRLQRLKATVASLGQVGAPELGARRRHWIRGDNPTLLVACDSSSPTNHHALLAPLATLGDLSAVVAHPGGVTVDLPGPGWREVSDPQPLWRSVTTVASIGDHLGVGAWATELAVQRGWRQVVVQHGLLTPFSPPPPPASEVLAWSDADARFLATGRPDLMTHVVGSPLLAAAAAHATPHVSRCTTPVFLGQLHGAELSRWSMSRSVMAFWRMTGAIYRPHPREEDVLSRAQHAVWQRMGMRIEPSPPLLEVHRPVVSAFSTGVLEAAARGVPAWVFHLSPPPWLVEFWGRYAMARWGDEPTPPPAHAHADPAALIGRHLAGRA